jgi:hypothetical protein
LPGAKYVSCTIGTSQGVFGVEETIGDEDSRCGWRVSAYSSGGTRRGGRSGQRREAEKKSWECKTIRNKPLNLDERNLPEGRRRFVSAHMRGGVASIRTGKQIYNLLFRLERKNIQ